MKDFTSARAEIQKHNAEEFFCEPPDFGKLQVLLATDREESHIQEKTTSKDKKPELIPCRHSPMHRNTEELQRCQGREKVSDKNTHLMHFITPYIHIWSRRFANGVVKEESMHPPLYGVTIA